MTLRAKFFSIIIALSLNSAFAYDVCHERGFDQCPLHSRIPETCQDMVFGALPNHINTNEVKICRNHYLVGANTVAKTPNWVAYHLTSAYHPDKDIERGKFFCPDPCLPAGQRAEASDYNNVYPLFNRGHMTPAKDNKWDIDSYRESFYLTNVVPQQPHNNDGIWLQLENYLDVWLKMYGDLYVISGPIYDYQGEKHQEVGKNKVWAPAALFKIIYTPNKQLVLSFIIPNKQLDPKTLPHYLTSIDEINKQTGLNLFSDLPKPLKAEVPKTIWPV